MKHFRLTLLALFACLMASAQTPAPISGPSSMCDGSTITLTDVTPGGTWTSSVLTVGTVGLTTGVVTGIAAGVTNITYTTGTGFVTHFVTVNPLPAPIVGPSTICVGGTAAYTDATPGGIWVSSTPAIGTIDPLTGVLTGISPGIFDIMYTFTSTGCTTMKYVTVNLTPGTISGPSSICAGGTGTLSCTPGGGLWSSSNPAVAVVGSSSGIVSGISLGTTTISYVFSTGCLSTTSVTVVAGTTIYTVTGGGAYCSGGTGVPVGITGSSVGVSYQLYLGGSPVGAPITGTGASLSFGMQTTAGTYTVVAMPGSGCSTSMAGSATVSVSALPTVYTLTTSGGGSYCAGGSGVHIILSGSDIGVNYQLFHGSTPVGSPMAGTGSSLDFGLYTITGTFSVIATSTGTGCTGTMSGTPGITISPLPIVYTVTGGGTYCSGGSGLVINMSGSQVGVNYQLYSGITAIGTPVAGTGAPVSFGLITGAGTYSVVATDATTSCSTTMSGGPVITITPTVTPAVSVGTSGGSTICIGTTVLFTATPVNGGSTPTYQWYRNSVTIGGATAPTYTTATIASGDTFSVVMTTSVPCPSTPTATGSIIMTISVPTITATSSIACGGTVTLTGSGGVSYSWAPTTGLSCPACSTTTTTPTSSNVYTVTGTDAFGCTGTDTISVDGNRISGQITYTGVSTDTFKVWLVQYDPTDSSIIALDSTNSCMIGGSTPYYEFMDAPAGTYMVKAKLNGTVPGTSGYIPTYSSSTPNWYAAATVTHGTTANTMNITMVYGTVPAGPGFISGYVYAGAGKGTTGDVPEPDMLVYLKDAAGNTLTYTYTDAAGAYSFSGLGYGSYIIYPEEYDYYTTPSSMITLSASVTSVTGLYFKKHTSYGTITPMALVCCQPLPAGDFRIYPNPTSSMLNIDCNGHATGNTEIILSDMTGREIFRTSVNVTSAGTKTALQLNDVNDGIYLVSVISGDFHYTGKLTIQR